MIIFCINTSDSYQHIYQDINQSIILAEFYVIMYTDNYVDYIVILDLYCSSCRCTKVMTVTPPSVMILQLPEGLQK